MLATQLGRSNEIMHATLTDWFCTQATTYFITLVVCDVASCGDVLANISSSQPLGRLGMAGMMYNTLQNITPNLIGLCQFGAYPSRCHLQPETIVSQVWPAFLRTFSASNTPASLVSAASIRHNISPEADILHFWDPGSAVEEISPVKGSSAQGSCWWLFAAQEGTLAAT